MKLFCGNLSIMAKSTVSAIDALQLMYDFQSQENEARGQPAPNCTDVSYAKYVDGMKRTEKVSGTDSKAGDQFGRLWTYQTCREFGWYQTCESGSNCPYTQGYNTINWALELCRLLFDMSPGDVLHNIDKTNQFYGGAAYPGATHTVFPNGEVDPWHWESTLVGEDPTVDTIFVKGASHCEWMHAVKPGMAGMLIEAKKAIQNKIASWLPVAESAKDTTPEKTKEVKPGKAETKDPELGKDAKEKPKDTKAAKLKENKLSKFLLATESEITSHLQAWLQKGANDANFDVQIKQHLDQKSSKVKELSKVQQECLVQSDHLPVLERVQLGELSETVNVLVWNTLEFPSLNTETLVVDGISPYCSEIVRERALLLEAMSSEPVILGHTMHIWSKICDALSADSSAVVLLQELNHDVANKARYCLETARDCAEMVRHVKAVIMRSWTALFSHANQDSSKCNAITAIVSQQAFEETTQVEIVENKKTRFFMAARRKETWFVSCHVPLVTGKKLPPGINEDRPEAARLSRGPEKLPVFQDVATKVLEQLVGELLSPGKILIAGGDWNGNVYEVHTMVSNKETAEDVESEVKLAQWAATRRDLFPDQVCAALGRMHESVSAPWSKTIEPAKVCSSLRDAEFDMESLESRPYASGSMAEVYFGRLRDGTEVAVKCMRPGVKHLLEADLAWLLRLSSWADSMAPLRLLHLGKAVEEFCEHVQMQTDFRTEASHLEQFQCNFKELAFIRFPSPLYASQELLVLSREMGKELSRVFRDAVAFGQQSVDQSSSLQQHAEDIRSILGVPQEVSQRIANDSLSAYMRMIFKDQFIHGDLHPGNVMVKLEEGSSPDVEEATTTESTSRLDRLTKRLRSAARSYSPPFQLIILDAGLAIPLPRDKVEALRSLALAIIYGDFYRAADILYQQSPDTSQCQDPQGFKNGLAKAFRDCRRQVYEDGFVQVSDSVLEALRLVRHYNVGLDTTLTWTLLGMLSIEGSARQLDPEVDCARAATRYILNMPSLWNELRSHSWHTSRHMFAEMFLTWLGIDYWEWRNSSPIFQNFKM
eukprot:s1695_g4.t1